MKTKMFAALLLTFVMMLAAFASEQRRICNAFPLTENLAVVVDVNSHVPLIALRDDATN